MPPITPYEPNSRSRLTLHFLYHHNARSTLVIPRAHPLCQSLPKKPHFSPSQPNFCQKAPCASSILHPCQPIPLHPLPIQKPTPYQLTGPGAPLSTIFSPPCTTTSKSAMRFNKLTPTPTTTSYPPKTCTRSAGRYPRGTFPVFLHPQTHGKPSMAHIPSSPTQNNIFFFISYPYSVLPSPVTYYPNQHLPKRPIPFTTHTMHCCKPLIGMHMTKSCDEPTGPSAKLGQEVPNQLGLVTPRTFIKWPSRCCLNRHAVSG